MGQVVIRRAEPAGQAELAAMWHSLWPDGSVDEHAGELAPILAGNPPGSLPAIIFVAQDANHHPVGFIYVGLRSHADGCDPSRPVGFIEGWYVAPEHRRRKIATQLLAVAEQWARSHGCREMASDTWLDHLESQQTHSALGFEVVDRCVHYRKRL